MADPVRIGIIGVGNMGSFHARYMSKIPGCRLAALCDVAPERIAQLSAELGAEAFHDSDSLIRSGKVDAVLIATPHYDHTPIAIAALDAGLHVLVEKPIAVHKGAAMKMIEASRRNPDRRFAAMFNQRTIPHHRKIKDLITRGELGKITRVNWIITDWYRTQAYYNSGGWRATWGGEGGGVLLNQCPHQLDLLQWFFGLPTSIQAFCGFGRRHEIEVEDDVTAYLEFSNGATGVFVTSTGDAPGTNRLEITADRGKLVYEGGAITFHRTVESVEHHLKNSPAAFDKPECWVIDIPVSGDASNQHQKVTENFVAAIQDPKVELIAPAQEGIRSVEIANAMLFSTLLGRIVDLPIDPVAYECKLKSLCDQSKFVKKQAAAASGDFSASFGR